MSISCHIFPVIKNSNLFNIIPMSCCFLSPVSTCHLCFLSLSFRPSCLSACFACDGATTLRPFGRRRRRGGAGAGKKSPFPPPFLTPPLPPFFIASLSIYLRTPSILALACSSLAPMSPTCRKGIQVGAGCRCRVRIGFSSAKRFKIN